MVLGYVLKFINFSDSALFVDSRPQIILFVRVPFSLTKQTTHTNSLTMKRRTKGTLLSYEGRAVTLPKPDTWIPSARIDLT